MNLTERTFHHPNRCTFPGWNGSLGKSHSLRIFLPSGKGNLFQGFLRNQRVRNGCTPYSEFVEKHVVGNALYLGNQLPNQNKDFTIWSLVSNDFLGHVLVLFDLSGLISPEITLSSIRGRRELRNQDLPHVLIRRGRSSGPSMKEQWRDYPCPYNPPQLSSPLGLVVSGSTTYSHCIQGKSFCNIGEGRLKMKLLIHSRQGFENSPDRKSVV